jgi:hypothetical protein
MNVICRSNLPVADMADRFSAVAFGEAFKRSPKVAAA